MPGVRSNGGQFTSLTPAEAQRLHLSTRDLYSDVQTTTSHGVVTGFTKANLEDSRATVQSLLELQV